MHCLDHNILFDHQFGLRHDRSTKQALVIFKTDVGHALNMRTPTIDCSTDIEKAFDTVWRDGLIYKLKTIIDFDDHLCKVIYHNLLNRSAAVQIQPTNSIPSAGVSEGSVLSALLYREKSQNGLLKTAD